MVGRRGPQRLQSGTSDMADLAGKRKFGHRNEYEDK